MFTKLTVILLVVVGAALAVPIKQWPWPPTQSICQSGCLLNDLSKVRYEADKTYEYELQVESQVQVNSLGEQAKLSWRSTVELYFSTPCEVTVQLKNTLLDGQSYPSFAKEISQYPLKATYVDGVFNTVCADPRDLTSSVNIKKGILSTIQNSLPSNATMYSGTTIVERDVLGVCPTNYTVQQQGQKTIVQKMKDHRLCKERFADTNQSPAMAAILKSPSALRRSESKCTQEFENGIIQSVSCRDSNEVTPAMGIKKFVRADQTSTLKFKRVSQSNGVPQLSAVRPTNMIYDFALGPGNSSAIPDLEAKLREISQTLKRDPRNNQTADRFSNLIEFLNQVPEKTVKDVLQKLKSGQYGDNVEQLESLYRDAIAFTTNNGAMPIMVDSIIQKKRVSQYTLSLFSMPRVCEHGVQSVKPLFEADGLPAHAILSAGSVVGTYCRTEGSPYNCEEVSQVQQVLESIKAKLSEVSAQSKSDDSKRIQTIALLKAVGNIRRMTESLLSSIVTLVHNKDLPQSVRVAAADSLKKIPCKSQVSSELLAIARKEDESPDMRVFAYKSGIECSSSADLTQLVDAITREADLNVRSYILSDLTSLQQSSNPQKLRISQKLAPLNISQDYPRDIWSTSLHSEKSFFAKSNFIGSELDFDIVYDSIKMMPTELRTNVTMELFKEIINVAEVGVRFENMPQILRKLVAPGSVLGESNLGQMVRGILSSMPKSSSESGKIDYFMKVFGTEMIYSSLNSEKHGQVALLNSIYEYVGDAFIKVMAKSSSSSMRGWQYKRDMTVSTIQGVPLMITVDIDAVTTFTSGSSDRSQSASSVALRPFISALMKNFVGYKFGPSVGMVKYTKLSMPSDITLTVKTDRQTISAKIDLPETDILPLDITSQGYLMTQKPGQRERRVSLLSRDPRSTGKNCSTCELLKIQYCYEYDVTNFLENNDYPLVKPSRFSVSLKKSNPAVRGFELTATKKSSENYQAKLKVLGTQTEVSAEFNRQTSTKNSQLVVMEVKSTDEALKGMKMIYESHSRGNSTDRSMDIFKGSQQQKVFTSFMKSGDREGALKIQTLGPWTRQLLVNVDVRGYLTERFNQTAKIEFEKMEFLFATENYRSESFMRVQQRQGARVHSCESSLKSHGSVLYNVSSLTTRLDVQSGFSLENNMTMRVGKEFYESYTSFKQQKDYNYFSMDITKDSSQKLLKALAYCDGSTETKRFSVIALELPTKDINWKFTSNLISKGYNNNDYEIHLLSKEKVFVVIKGPLEIVWTNTTKKVATSLGIRGSEQINYHVEGLFEMSPETNTTQIAVRNQSSLVMEYKHAYIWAPSTKSLESKLVVPDKIHSDISILFKPEDKLKISGDMKVPAISPRHLQGHMNAVKSGSEVHYSSLLRWDVDRDPEKKLSASGVVKTENDHKIIQGECTKGRDVGYYDISYALIHHGENDVEKDIVIHIKNRTSEVITFKSRQRIAILQHTDMKVENILSLKTPHGSIYELEHGLEIREVDSRVSVKSIVMLNTPRLARVESRFDWKSQSQSQSSLSGFLKRSPQSPAQTPLDIQYHGDFKFDPRRALESAKLSLDAEVSGKKVSLSASDSSRTGETRMNILKNSSPQVELIAKRDGAAAMEVTVKVPSLRAEMICKVTENEKSIKIIPDITHRQKMIEMKFRRQHTAEGVHRTVRVEYPHNGRQKSIESVCVGGEATVELDVMAHRQNIMRVLIKTINLSHGSRRFIVSLASQRESESLPTMTIDTKLHKHEKSLVASFQRDAKTPATSVVKLQFVEQSPVDGVIAFAVSSPQSKFEFGGSYKSLVRNGVQGFQVNTTMKIPDREPYLVQLMASKPAFIKVVTGKKISSDRYVAKLGLESYTHAELSLMKDTQETSTPQWKKMSGQDFSQAEHPIFAMSTKLLKPDTLALRVQNSKKTREEFKNAVKTEYQEIRDKMVQFMSQLTEKFAEEVESKIPQSRLAMQGLRDFLRTIKESQMVNTISKPIAELTTPLLETLDSAFDSLHKVSKQVETSYERFIEKHSSLRKSFNDFVQSIEDRIKEELQLDSNEVDPDIIHMLIELIKKFLDSIIKKNCSWSADKCQKLENAVNQICDHVEEDLLNALRLFGRDQSVGHAKSLLRSYVDMYSRKEYMSMVESAVIALSPQHIGLKTHKNGYQINLPLRQPLGSVLLTPWHIGMRPNPFGETFEVLGLDSVRLTNGSVINLPDTKCEYWLYLPANHRTKMTFGNLKKDNHFQTITFKEHTIVYHINQKTINIDGNKHSNGDNLSKEITPGFRILQRYHRTLIHTPDVIVAIHWFKKNSIVYVNVHGDGVPFLRMNNSESDYSKLMKMSKYQTVKTCVP